MQLTEIRRRLDDLTAPGAPAPAAAEVAKLKRAWAQIKPQVPSDYHPIIDDRIALCDR